RLSPKSLTPSREERGECAPRGGGGTVRRAPRGCTRHGGSGKGSRCGKRGSLLGRGPVGRAGGAWKRRAGDGVVWVRNDEGEARNDLPRQRGVRASRARPSRDPRRAR